MTDPVLQRPDAFCPCLRFCVCSDLHIKEADDEHVNRLRQLMRTAYQIAEADALYPKLDAFLFAGDLTDHGKPAQFRAFWDTVQSERQPGTQVLACIPRYHDNWEFGKGGKKTGLGHFRAITGLSTDTHLQIGPFHFIAVSTSEKDCYYDRKQKRWLKQALKDAAKDNPDAPVFFMQHEHARNTVYGSSAFDGWGLTHFSRIFRKYPNLVHFSGHSHYPLNDPRSIFQKDFTAVGTGALSYAEFTVGARRTVHPPACESIAQGWMVEVDSGNTVVLRGYDFLSGALLCTYVLRFPANKQAFPFTPERQKARSSPPVFPADAALRTDRTADGYSLICPAAQSGDAFSVFRYVAEGFDENGRLLCSADTLHEYWFAHEKATYTISLPAAPGLKSVAVRAENAYGMASAPIITTL